MHNDIFNLRQQQLNILTYSNLATSFSVCSLLSEIWEMNLICDHINVFV